MERLVFRGSPLAEYLEGEGEACLEWAPLGANHEAKVPISFAPPGLSSLGARLRKKMPHSLRIGTSPQDTITQRGRAWSRSVKATLRQAENEHFLEQFRYVIVASQLLDVHGNVARYSSLNPASQTAPDLQSNASAPKLLLSASGACMTGLVAFLFVWMLHWVRGGGNPRLHLARILLASSCTVVLLLILFSYVRRQRLVFLRQQAVNSAAQLVAGAQDFDTAAAMALSMIQDVELVSRGYRLGTSLPPISRIEERSHNRRCSRLRRMLQSSLASVTPVLDQAHNMLRPLVDDDDLPKYIEIYDLDDLHTQKTDADGGPLNDEDQESLKWLKAAILRQYNSRRLFLCSLLALPAIGDRYDFVRWSTAIELMREVTASSVEHGEKLKKILLEEDRIPSPASPRKEITPAEERLRMQLRKLGSLSQGVRGLQAKLHVLREESENNLEATVDIAELGPSLIAQYDLIGDDLRTLMREWECGKASLASHVEKNERRISQVSGSQVFEDPKSPTMSLDGSTVVEGSPLDALRTLNGENTSHSSTDLSAVNTEEIFEAIGVIGAPPQRSVFSRDERIAMMKEERARASLAREKAQANTHMLRELESVINLRPRGGKAGSRIISI